jgi:hypothetical protein
MEHCCRAGGDQQLAEGERRNPLDQDERVTRSLV